MKHVLSDKMIMFCLAAMILISVFGCRKSMDVMIDTGTEFYPLFDGKFLEYRVDSIIFDDGIGGNVKDTFRSVVREVYKNPQVNAVGDTVFELHRMWKPLNASDFSLTHIWSAQKNEFEAIRREGNLQFQIFEFSLDTNSTWDITTYFDKTLEVPIGTEIIEMYLIWRSKMINFKHSDQVGDFSFGENEVLTVEHADSESSTLIHRKVTEKYARHVGLVYREMAILDSRCNMNPIDCEGIPWDDHAAKGFRLTQTLVAHN